MSLGWQNRVASALLAPERGQAALGPGVEGHRHWRIEGGKPCTERELATKLRSSAPPQLVALTHLTPTLLRALRGAPPAVLVLLEGADEFDGVAEHVLGPFASVRNGPGDIIAAATCRDELEGLCRAFGDDLRLGMCPTPAWLWKLGDAPNLGLAGYVPRRALTIELARWSERTETPHVLVPIGVETPDLERAEDLEVIVAAHTLERWTGPVFPAARVIRLTLAGLRDRPTVEAAPTQTQRDIWVQARRTLPIAGANVGMEAPQAGLDLRAPTAAFLAQRALLRAARARALVGEPPPPPQVLDDDGIDRAQEILRSASQALTDQESKVVLRGFGLEVTRQAVANSASGAVGFAERIGYPVVLKALSPDLRRRSDVGGVMLALSTASAVRRAYATIVDNIERAAPQARLDGILVAEMLGEGLDLRCGAMRLQSGDTVLYGQPQGGPIGTEPALALSPLSPSGARLLAHAVVSRIVVPALRRHSDPDVLGLAQLFLRIDAIFQTLGSRIARVDLSPVRLVGPPRGYVTLDARILQEPHLEGL